jgi:FkbM family methyltransferase
MARLARRWIGRVLPRRAKALYRALRRRGASRRSRHRRVFVDCGANTCTVLRSFVKKLPKDFEFVAFEPQPELRRAGRRAVRDLRDTKIDFIPKAVWIENGVIDLYLATEWGRNHRGGSTLIAGHTKNKSSVDYADPVRVEALDFSEWLRRNFDEDDHVIVKMDIEGAEYDVLEKVIRDGNLPLIDELIVEFHQRMNDTIPKERHERLLATLEASPCRLEIWH